MGEATPVAASGRREFLAGAAAWLGGLFGFGGFALRFFQYLYPVVPPEQIVEVPAGRRDAIPAGRGTVVRLPTGPVALLDVDGEVRAFSAICTHLGCLVRWELDMDHLHCPCHHGMFDRQGRVIGGPPPRPLDRFPVEVREGQVYVKVKVRAKVVTA